MPEQHPLDDYRLPAFQNLTPPDRFDAFITSFDKAETDGAIALLPASEAEVRTEEIQGSRIRTIRTRLYLLGYIKYDNQSPKIDEKAGKGPFVDFKPMRRLPLTVGWAKKPGRPFRNWSASSIPAILTNGSQTATTIRHCFAPSS